MQQQRSHTISADAPIAVLYQRYAPMLLAYVRRHIASPEDAEDVLLEVFLAAIERDALAGLSEETQLAWLRRVAHNKCIDRYRRAARRVSVPLEEVTETIEDDETTSPEQAAVRNEEHALLRTHLAQLPELQQEVLRLRFAVGLRSAEIAEHLNKREGAVRMLLSRALNLLRAIYENQ